jgi:hypothetical protein
VIRKRLDSIPTILEPTIVPEAYFQGAEQYATAVELWDLRGGTVVERRKSFQGLAIGKTVAWMHSVTKTEANVRCLE